jgi:hypothetical protein
MPKSHGSGTQLVRMSSYIWLSRYLAFQISGFPDIWLSRYLAGENWKLGSIMNDRTDITVLFKIGLCL